ncbi:hypothetical protein L873DRAFT_1785580 [Choiromyces venosus 120613-1]|uniref:Uncharacterized protein n=1 Tax=Choiromyces venosus 120613-1 TaxID=1336337 RepID=A0A3N4K4Q8_9PEZI|nr:hypothetical protein L873DRAFT_1785580 [Choiromyces venosus 120613-1]
MDDRRGQKWRMDDGSGESEVEVERERREMDVLSEEGRRAKRIGPESSSFSGRKVRFTNRFLPISAPFYSPYLESATGVILEDHKEIRAFAQQGLAIPVFHTSTCQTLHNRSGDKSIISELVNMITQQPVHWGTATVFLGTTHILYFGPGNISGLGFLTHRNKDGTGVLITIAGTFEGTNNEVGYKLELFDRDSDQTVRSAVNWLKKHDPKFARIKQGETFVDTKLSRLLGGPSVMAAGMTPSTVPWDLVAATMNARYQIELAGKLYHFLKFCISCADANWPVVANNAKGLTAALQNIEQNTIPSAHITVNLIYLSPRAMEWQIPLLQQLHSAGVPIEELTIGAGHRQSRLPTSILRQADINIAKANLTFSVILQWTGGRGSGHHSFEDFHQSILQMYTHIWRCGDIALIAGSGLGGAGDTYPFLTKAGSKKFKYPPMPVDGLLLGSRMMTEKEAHTSLSSEMGEPIHKLAARNVGLCQSLVELKKQCDYIIKHLNADFQKTWFGRNSNGEAVDLEDMTSAEVFRRMVELMYIKHESHLINPSLKRLTGDFIQHIEERFTLAEGPACLLQNYTHLDDPFASTEKILAHYLEAHTQLLNAQDMQHFLLLCQQRRQKSLPFVPSLDENFEFWFRKDSLWQSKHLEAVVDQDVGRTSILQGPMAAKHSTIINEHINDILDGIHNGHITALTTDVYGGAASAIPLVAYFGGKPISSLDEIERVDGLTVSEEGGKTTFILTASTSQDALPGADPWLRLLAGETYSWRHALFTLDDFDNPMRHIFAPAHGMVKTTNARDPAKTVTAVKEKTHNGGCYVKTIENRMWKEKEILIDLIEEGTILGKSASLPLRFRYHLETSCTSIREVIEGRKDRMKEFYYWFRFGDEKVPLDAAVTYVFNGGRAQITRQAIADFVHVVGKHGEAFVERPGKTIYAPMDFAIMEWLHLDDPDTGPLGQTITFRLSSFIRFRDKKIFSSVETLGRVLVELPTKWVIQVASVEYITGQSHRNPVIDYLQRHGTSIEQPVDLDSAILLNAEETSPSEPWLAMKAMLIYANLAETITHEMFSSTAMRSLAEIWAAENIIARVRSFMCNFVSMVLPNDNIETKLHHAGMVSGRKIIKVEATNKETQERVLVGEAEVEQPVSAYIFTGQGSPEPGLGMGLYESSPIARKVWDRADRHFIDNYALAKVIPIESLVSVVFYHGLTMQVTVERATEGRSKYSMIAVNPSRISKTFNEQALPNNMSASVISFLMKKIAKSSIDPSKLRGNYIPNVMVKPFQLAKQYLADSKVFGNHPCTWCQAVRLRQALNYLFTLILHTRDTEINNNQGRWLRYAIHEVSKPSMNAGLVANRHELHTGKEISPRRRAVIIAFRSLPTPISFKKIREATGVAISTAHDIWQHASANAQEARDVTYPLDLLNTPLLLSELIQSSNLDSDARSGRPALLSKEDKDRLIAFIKRDFDTRRMQMIDIQREAGFSHVSVTTLLRALKERKVGAYHEEFKPILTAENKKIHLEYCKEREYWLPARQWADYAFTDEMSIEVGTCFGVNLVWREQGEQWHEDCVGKKKKGVTVMCWGMIGWNWKGPFHIWAKETRVEKEEATRAVCEWNKEAGRKEDELNAVWRGTEEWRELKEVELAALRAARSLRAAAKERGEKITVPQSWQAKKFKIVQAQRKDAKGIDSW